MKLVSNVKALTPGRADVLEKAATQDDALGKCNIVIQVCVRQAGIPIQLRIGKWGQLTRNPASRSGREERDRLRRRDVLERDLRVVRQRDGGIAPRYRGSFHRRRHVSAISEKAH